MMVRNEYKQMRGCNERHEGVKITFSNIDTLYSEYYKIIFAEEFTIQDATCTDDTASASAIWFPSFYLKFKFHFIFRQFHINW